MKTTIIGSKFRPGGLDALSRIKKGDPLILVREADNAFDSNAVAVYSRDNEHLGFVPRSANTELARDLDAGCEYLAAMEDEAIIEQGDLKFPPKISITILP